MAQESKGMRRGPNTSPRPALGWSLLIIIKVSRCRPIAACLPTGGPGTSRRCTHSACLFTPQQLEGEAAQSLLSHISLVFLGRLIAQVNECLKSEALDGGGQPSEEPQRRREELSDTLTKALFFPACLSLEPSVSVSRGSLKEIRRKFLHGEIKGREGGRVNILRRR